MSLPFFIAMFPYFILFLISLIAAIGTACAIQFFLDPGPWKAFGYALIAIAVFMLFAASGMWDGASEYEWGYLTIVFALMLVGGFLCIRYGKRIWEKVKDKL